MLVLTRRLTGYSSKLAEVQRGGPRQGRRVRAQGFLRRRKSSLPTSTNSTRSTPASSTSGRRSRPFWHLHFWASFVLSSSFSRNAYGALRYWPARFRLGLRSVLEAPFARVGDVRAF